MAGEAQRPEGDPGCLDELLRQRREERRRVEKPMGGHVHDLGSGDVAPFQDFQDKSARAEEGRPITAHTLRCCPIHRILVPAGALMASESPRLQSIVDLAAELFFRHGYEGTSMQDVADAAGLHKSSLYHHVRSKVELLEIISTSALDSLFVSIDEAVASAVTPGEQIVAIFDGAARLALSDVRPISIVLHLNEDVGVGEQVWARRREYDRRVAELMRAAQLGGEVRKDIEALLLTRLVLGMINWVTEWYRPGKGRYDTDEVTRSLTAFVRQGIRPPDTTKPQELPSADADTRRVGSVQ